MVDVADEESAGRKAMGVRISPPLPSSNKENCTDITHIPPYQCTPQKPWYDDWDKYQAALHCWNQEEQEYADKVRLLTQGHVNWQAPWDYFPTGSTGGFDFTIVNGSPYWRLPGQTFFRRYCEPIILFCECHSSDFAIQFHPYRWNNQHLTISCIRCGKQEDMRYTEE